MLVDAAAFAVVIAFGRDRRVAHVGWWWLGVPAAARSRRPRPHRRRRRRRRGGRACCCLATAPRLAGVLLTVADLDQGLARRAHRRGLRRGGARGCGWSIAAIVTSGVILLVSIAARRRRRQCLQLHHAADRTRTADRVGGRAPSGCGTPSPAGRGASTIYYDTSILTYQLHGQGVQTAAAIATPLLALVTLALLLLAIVIVRRGASAAELLPPLALAITTALILFNKVGSPQFVTWLAVPIVLGLSTAATGRGTSFRFPAVLALVIADLTQVIYPYLYDQLLASEPLDAARAQRAQPALSGAAGLGRVEHGAPAAPGRRPATGRRVELAAPGVAVRAGAQQRFRTDAPVTAGAAIAAPTLSPVRIRLALLALALGGFGIGATEFVAMGLLPNIAADLLPDAVRVIAPSRRSRRPGWHRSRPTPPESSSGAPTIAAFAARLPAQAAAARPASCAFTLGYGRLGARADLRARARRAIRRGPAARRLLRHRVARRRVADGPGQARPGGRVRALRADDRERRSACPRSPSSASSRLARRVPRRRGRSSR